jgi:CheY-like chemotaxis protein
MSILPPRILHIEDDLVDRMVVQRLLTKYGLAEGLMQAGNGEDALALIERCQKPYPRAVLLDINMPRMNGLEFLESLRNKPPDFPLSIYMLTTSMDEKDRLQAYKFGVAGYFVKPVDMAGYDVLFETLKAFWLLNQWPDENP